MSGGLSVTAGGFTLSGFASNATTLGGYNATFALTGASDFFFSVATQTDENVFNWAANVVRPPHLPAGPQVVSATPINGELWTLNVLVNATDGGTGSRNNDYVTYYATGGQPISKAGALGNRAGVATSFSLTGSGSSDLQALIRALDVRVDPGNAVGVTFTLTDNTASGAATTWTEYFLACFVAGTRIAVPAGEIAVESLRIGDHVMTRSGDAKPVKWIGTRSYSAAQIAANRQFRPVIIRKDALAAGMPHRDLTVSAMHSLLIDDVLVPAAALVNGVSILRSDELLPVAYFHIEMAEHDVVFAEGAPAETFVDDNSRVMFENADEYYDRYGADRGACAFSAARVEEGYQLEAIRRRLAARAGAAAAAPSRDALRGHVEALEAGVLRGWAMDVAAPSAAVELNVIADGEWVGQVIANRYRADLDHARLGDGRCGFSVPVPASVTSLEQVTVRRVSDGARLPVQLVVVPAA